jgi:membrane protease YdiL (CAAX protease family)
MICPTLVTMLYFVWLADAPGAVQQSAYTLGKVVQFGFPLAWVLIARPPAGAIPPPDERGERSRGFHGLMWGVAFGIAVSVAMWVVYHFLLKPSGYFAVAQQQITARLRNLAIDSWWKFIALGVFYAMVHSGLEEYYFRWFLFGQLRRESRVSTAVLVSSLAFMAHHVILLKQFFGWSLPTFVFSAAVAVGGACWALLYQRSRSLIAAWVSHLLVDAAIFFLIGIDVARPWLQRAG